MSKKYEIISTGYDKRGRIVARGINDYSKSHSWQKHLSEMTGCSSERIYMHSEVSCLIRAKNLKKKVDTLKIERYGADGKPRNAFPCVSCQLGIKLSGVKSVIFTTEDGLKEWIV